MGHLKILSTDLIKPSQNFLKEDTLRFILECIIHKEYEKLPPAPIVRAHQYHYDAIDGHNLLAVKSMLQEKVQVYVAQSPNDELVAQLFPHATANSLASRNLNLQQKYEVVTANAAQVQAQGIKSIQDLQQKYAFLKDFETARLYFNL